MEKRTEDHRDTKALLIGVAWELFARNGYDSTPVQAIIDKAGVSKGTFYHYFSSKEDILDVAVEHMAKEGFDQIAASVRDNSLSALERLNQFFAASWRWKLANIGVLIEVARVLYRDENIIIRHKMNVRTLALAVPPLASIMSQGVEEGVFDVADPQEAARFILHMGNSVVEMQVKSLLELEDKPDILAVLEQRLVLYLKAVEGVLGAPQGSIKGVDRSFFEGALQAIREQQ